MQTITFADMKNIPINERMNNAVKYFVAKNRHDIASALLETYMKTNETATELFPLDFSNTAGIEDRNKLIDKYIERNIEPYLKLPKFAIMTANEFIEYGKTADAAKKILDDSNPPNL
jgi:hypothetical protein